MSTTKRKATPIGRPSRLSTPSTKLVTIRTTETERDRINARAAKLGMSTAEYIRSKIFA